MTGTAKYAIVDIETTGGSPKFERVTEVGIVLSDGHQVIDTFESLVNPEQTIPEFITRLTGITNEMAVNAPKFFEIARNIVELTDNAVFVAHNARFDYGFLRAEFQRLGYTFSRKQLCTVKLTRRVFPGLPSYSLGKLIAHFGISVNRRHRALDDALATAELLHRALRNDPAGADVTQLVNRGIRETQLPPGITLEALHQIPEGSGVYYFHNADNRVVYVGKSINIRKRVMDHFKDHTAKAGRMHKHVRDITWELTGSELVALLHESAEIKRLNPPINRAQRLESFPYVVSSYPNDDGYLCFRIDKVNTKSPLPDYAEPVAEYPKLTNARGHLGRIVQELELCRRLCGLEKQIGTCLYHQIGLCRGGCMGAESPDDYNERAARVAEHLAVQLPGSFAIVDEGRSPDECAVVVVENGHYQGFGYLDLSEAASTEALRDCIRPQQSNPEVLRIIRLFLRKNPTVKKIPLEGF